MKRVRFLEKTKELQLYTERYDTITLFEISQLYGTSLVACVSFLLSLPLLIFSTQWIALPLGFIVMILAGWIFFDLRLWLPDTLKAVAIPSQTLKTVLGWVITCVQKVQSLIPASPQFEDYQQIFKRVSPILMIITSFMIGFIQSPQTNYFSILTLILLSLDMLVDTGYLTYAGYAAFIISLY